MNQFNLTSAYLLFTIMSSLIALGGLIIVYLNRKNTKKDKKKYDSK
jgi:hypothetical protein